MIKKLSQIKGRYRTITASLEQPDIVKNQEKYRTLRKELAELEPIITAIDQYEKIDAEITSCKEILDTDDHEIAELAEDELRILQGQRSEIENLIQKLLIPKDPFDQKNCYIEIRAGTGGEEACLFVGDLFRLYSRYCERNQYTMEIMNAHPTGIGGYKEIIALVKGPSVFGKFKYEGGVHRVQRVPETESQGRVHTSAVTVAVLPEASDVEVTIAEKDLRIDVYRSSGPGGQSVNTTDSAVRITHIPTGIVVAMQDEKSQHKNKSKALKILQARLLEFERQKQQDKRSATRKSMVGSGDRSEKIRTYNYPQNRLTDHRINLTLYKLDIIMDGELDDIISALATHFQAAHLSAAKE